MATSPTEFNVQSLYVGYLGRAAEFAGRDFWVEAIDDGRATLSQIATEFSNQPEYKALYDGLTNAQFVAAVYRNVLGRPAEPDGLSFWLGKINSGEIPRDQLVLNIIQSMSAIDRVKFDSRVQAGNDYTEAAGASYVLAEAQEAVGLLNFLRASVDGAAATSVDEGQTVQFKFNTIDFFPGQTLSYTITGVGAADVVGGSLSGTVTLDALNQAVVSITLVEDALTEGPETLTLSLGGLTSSVTVNDTSVSPAPPTFTLGAFVDGLPVTDVNEGQTVVFLLQTTNVPAGSVFSYAITGVSASDVVGGSLTGTTTVDSQGNAVIQVTLAADGITEGAESMTLLVAGQSVSVTVNDTSTAGNTLTVGIDTLVGTDGVDDVFYGPLAPNALGQSSNTFQPTDSINGGANSTNSLIATVISQGTNLFGTVPIDANTDNVQKMFLTATGGDTVLIDAYRNASWNMDDVEEWWSIQSDTDLTVTDATLNTFVGMDSTAPGVNYSVFFRPQSLDGSDEVSIVLDNVGTGQQGGSLIVGSTTPGNGNLGLRGIETFNVLIGASDSFLTDLDTTGDRLTTVNVADGGATSNTVLQIADEFDLLTTFDASGFSGITGTAANPMTFEYGKSVPAASLFAGSSTVSGSQGGNTMEFLFATKSALTGTLAVNGGAGNDSFLISDISFPLPRGDVGTIVVDAGEGNNETVIEGLNSYAGGTMSVAGGAGTDDVTMRRFDTYGVDINVGDGDNSVTIDHQFPPVRNKIEGNLSVVAGAGFDDILVRRTDVNILGVGTGNASIDVGEGGANVHVTVAEVESDLSISGGDGDHDIEVGGDVIVGGDAAITLGDGWEKIRVHSSAVTSIGGNLTITIGDGDAAGNINIIEVDDVTIGGNVAITSGEGRDDVLIGRTDIGDGAPANGNLTVNTNGGDDAVSLTDVDFHGSSATVNTGAGDDTVYFEDVYIEGPVSVDTDGGADQVSFVDGDFTNGLGDNTVVISTGSDSDTVSVDGGYYDLLSIDTGSDDANDSVSIDAVDFSVALSIVTGGGDDSIEYFDTATEDLAVDGGDGFDSFRTNEDLGTPGNTPTEFSNIERLGLARDFTGTQTVDMGVLNSVSKGGIVSEVWVEPSTTASGGAKIDNLASDLGQRVVITNDYLPYPGIINPWTTGNGYVGDVAISTLIDDEADNRTLNVVLDASNAPTTNAPVTAVGKMVITDNSIGAASVEIVRMESTSLDGVTGSRNVVQNFSADQAELLRIIGDRALALHIGDLNADTVVDLFSSRDVVDIRANTLNGDLQLVLLGDNLSTSTESTDQIRANPAYTNLLALYGTLNVLTGTAVGETTISGFQTIQFGTDTTGVMTASTGLGLGLTLGAQGYFDAGALPAGTVYDIVQTSGALTIDNLASTVKINAAGVSNDDITLNAGSGVTLDLSLYVNGSSPDVSWTNGWEDVYVNYFTNLNLDIESSGIANTWAWVFDLWLDSYLDSLVITGGDFDDSLELQEPLPTTVNAIDVSGFAGSFTAFFDPTANTPLADVIITVGSNDLYFTLTEYAGGAGAQADTDTALAQFNTVFRFTGDAFAEWVIDGFVFGGMTGANINNWTKLDLRAIGVTEDIGVNVVKIDWDGDGADDLHVWADGFDFSIVLLNLGVLPNSENLLTNDNLIFAGS